MRSCSGCCSLKTGTIIIGVLGITFGVFFIIVTFMANIQWQLITNMDEMTAKITVAIYYCLTILFCMLLIIGSIKKNAFMLLPWMVLSMMSAIVLFVSIVRNAIMFINYGLVSSHFSFFFNVVAVKILICLWLVVYGHFRKLRIESKNCAQERVSIKNHMVSDDYDKEPGI